MNKGGFKKLRVLKFIAEFEVFHGIYYTHAPTLKPCGSFDEGKGLM